MEDFVVFKYIAMLPAVLGLIAVEMLLAASERESVLATPRLAQPENARDAKTI